MSTLSNYNEANEYTNIYLVSLDFIKNIFLNNDYFKNNRKKNGFINVYTKFINSNDIKFKNSNVRVLCSYIDDKKSINNINIVLNSNDITTLSNALRNYNYSFVSNKDIDNIIDEFKVCKDFNRLFKRYVKYYLKYYGKLVKYQVKNDNTISNEIKDIDKELLDKESINDVDNLINEFNEIASIKDFFEEDDKKDINEAKLVEEDNTKVEVIDDITALDDIPFDSNEIIVDNSINDIPTLSKDDTIEEMFKEEVIIPNKDENDNKKVLDVIGIPDGKKIIRTNDNSNLKENEINHIRTRLYNEKDNSSLTNKEKIRIREVFNLNDDKSYFSSYTVDNAFNINCYIRNILSNNDILNSICSTAINCYLIRIDYLKETDIAYRDLETNRLFNLLGANNTNKLYKVAYDMFMKNLNKLDVNDQVKIRDNFKDKSFDLYRYLFSVNYFKIVSPADLIILVNIKISEYVIENFEFYTDYESIDLYLNLFHVTNDMNISEILNVYIGLKNKLNKKYGNNIKEYNLRIEKIQEYFSIIIDNIINRDKLDINQNEKKKRLLSICEKYLKDEPKFSYNNENNENIIFGKNRLEEIIDKMNNMNKE